MPDLFAQHFQQFFLHFRLTGETGRLVLDVTKLPNLARKNNVDIAILTVPGKYAQKTADFLVSAEIKYIWNFTPTVLSVPKDVQVWNENLMGNFLQFTYNI